MQQKIDSCSVSQKALFRCMDELLYKSKAIPERLPDSFQEKIEKIQHTFTSSDSATNSQTANLIQKEISI